MQRTIFSILVIVCSFGVSAHDVKLSGEYIYGSEVLTFTPCGSEKTYWIDISGWVHDPLIKFYEKNTTKPYQSIYVSVRGHMHDEEPDGYAVDYDGIFYISEIYSFSATIPEACKSHNKALKKDADKNSAS